MLVRWTKRILWLALALLLTLSLFVLHSLYFKPVSIRIFYERVFAEYALDDPQMLTSLGLLRPLGLRYYNANLTDASLARDAKLRTKLKRDLATLASYSTASMSRADKLSYDVLHYFLSMQVEGERFYLHNYPVNQMFGVQNGTPDFMVQQHQVRDERDAVDYISRLQQFDRRFSQTLEGLELRAAKGIVPPRFVLEKVRAEMQNFIAEGAGGNLLSKDFASKVDALKDLNETRKTELKAQAEAAVQSAVLPAYQKLIAYFDSLLSKQQNNHGVWTLPDGDAFYQFAVAQQTTTRMDPKQLHDIGLAEVARIQASMDQILTDAGITEGSFAERMRTLAEHPDQLYPDSDAGRAQILRDYQSMIDEISAGLDPMFRVRPKAKLEVKRVPTFREKTSAGAYYQRPALDGSRPGVFYANLRDVREIPKFGMRTLAYHEGVPGHHFQIATMQELQGVPTFRRVLPFTAYSEGWALYTEQLAWEAGFQKNPLDNLGRLQAELFRAVRLVVDTGMHRMRWSREQAIDYMAANTGMGEKEVTAEIERYLVMPAQALAYKTGMLKILELRERAKAALGAAFDIRDFHDVVLAQGAMPLEILEREVDAYIAANKPRDSDTANRQVSSSAEIAR
jgi:uncharacterized protein (DUF885 family)